jgi:hypothetical protein
MLSVEHAAGMAQINNRSPTSARTSTSPRSFRTSWQRSFAQARAAGLVSDA